MLTKYSSISPSVVAHAAPADQTDLDQWRLDDRADVHAVHRGGASIADVHPPFAVAEQLLPLVVGLQRVSAVLDEGQHVVEVLPRQRGVRGGCRDLRIDIVRQERRAAGQAKQVLRQHIKAAGTRRVAIQFARSHTQHGGLAFKDLEPIGRHQDRARGLIHPVIGAPDPLQQAGHALWRTDLDYLIDAAPIDAQVQRRRRHHRPQRAGCHGGFDLAALFHLQRAVVQGDRQHRIIQLPQRLEDQFRLGAGVDKDDRHAGVADQRHDLRRRLQPHMAGPGQPAGRQGH